MTRYKKIVVGERGSVYPKVFRDKHSREITVDCTYNPPCVYVTFFVGGEKHVRAYDPDTAFAVGDAIAHAGKAMKVK